MKRILFVSVQFLWATCTKFRDTVSERQPWTQLAEWTRPPSWTRSLKDRTTCTCSLQRTSRLLSLYRKRSIRRQRSTPTSPCLTVVSVTTSLPQLRSLRRLALTDPCHQTSGRPSSTNYGRSTMSTTLASSTGRRWLLFVKPPLSKSVSASKSTPPQSMLSLPR